MPLALEREHLYSFSQSQQLLMTAHRQFHLGASDEKTLYALTVDLKPIL